MNILAIDTSGPVAGCAVMRDGVVTRLVEMNAGLTHSETIMPAVDDPQTVRPYFRRMREWFDRLRDMDLPGIEMQTLSMGMSDDAVVAAQEGATMVRLGRALFGERK